MQLRFATGGAAEGWARVRVASSPYLLGTEESVRHDMAHDPATLARYVVVEQGEVLGIGRVQRHPGATPSVLVQVHPDHRGRGVGRMLLDRLLAVAGEEDLTGLVNGDDRSLAVAGHWGFLPERELRVSSADPRTVPDPGPTPAGFEVVTLEKAGARAVWSCFEATAADDPSGLTRTEPWEDYVATQWDHPLHRPDLGSAVLTGGTVVAFSQVEVAGDRAWTTMTGCRSEHRGRGLATLAKAHTLRALAAAGVTRCSTGNDESNAAMLAVNARLGYRPSASMWSARRPAGAATS
jgi:GNAT superfamily N-acetyltransferase